MVETKELNREVIDFLKERFNMDIVNINDEPIDTELTFKLQDNSIEAQINKELDEHFSHDSVLFHTIHMGGVLAVLIETF